MLYNDGMPDDWATLLHTLGISSAALSICGQFAVTSVIVAKTPINTLYANFIWKSWNNINRIIKKQDLKQKLIILTREQALKTTP